MKKTIVILLTIFSLSITSSAYEVGDTIDEKIASKINLGEGITVVDFFASWCVSCKKELPLINNLSHELNSKVVKFVGIDTDENVEEGKAFQENLKLDFFIFNDNKQEIVQKFNPIGMPAIYYIKNKKVVKVLFGAVDHIDTVIKKDIGTL
jgi:thiol-disulfide isomerase/thioredoxin